MPLTNKKTFSPETCPPLSLGHCEWIDRHDPDPPAVDLTPYEWMALLDIVQTAIEDGLLNTKATCWAQLLCHQLHQALFPPAMVTEWMAMTTRRAEKQ